MGCFLSRDSAASPVSPDFASDQQTTRLASSDQYLTDDAALARAVEESLAEEDARVDPAAAEASLAEVYVDAWRARAEHRERQRQLPSNANASFLVSPSQSQGQMHGSSTFSRTPREATPVDNHSGNAGSPPAAPAGIDRYAEALETLAPTFIAPSFLSPPQSEEPMVGADAGGETPSNALQPPTSPFEGRTSFTSTGPSGLGEETVRALHAIEMQNTATSQVATPTAPLPGYETAQRLYPSNSQSSAPSMESTLAPQHAEHQETVPGQSAIDIPGASAGQNALPAESEPSGISPRTAEAIRQAGLMDAAELQDADRLRLEQVLEESERTFRKDLEERASQRLVAQIMEEMAAETESQQQDSQASPNLPPSAQQEAVEPAETADNSSNTSTNVAAGRQLRRRRRRRTNPPSIGSSAASSMVEESSQQETDGSEQPSPAPSSIYYTNSRGDFDDDELRAAAEASYEANRQHLSDIELARRIRTPEDLASFFPEFDLRPGDARECEICCHRLRRGVKMLPCCHMHFHPKCLESCFKHARRCPFCNFSYEFEDGLAFSEGLERKARMESDLSFRTAA